MTRQGADLLFGPSMNQDRLDLPKQRNIWPVVWPMSERGEFVFVPMKRAVRDSVAQIGNHTSKSEASIHSGTALNAGESFDGTIGSRTSKGTQR